MSVRVVRCGSCWVRWGMPLYAVRKSPTSAQIEDKLQWCLKTNRKR